MELVLGLFQPFWNIMAPTTWLLVLGILVSFTLLRKALG